MQYWEFLITSKPWWDFFKTKLLGQTDSASKWSMNISVCEFVMNTLQQSEILPARTRTCNKKVLYTQTIINDLTGKLSSLLNLQWRQCKFSTIQRLIYVVTLEIEGDTYRLCPIYLYFVQSMLSCATRNVTWHKIIVYILFYIQTILGLRETQFIAYVNPTSFKTTGRKLIYAEIYVSSQADYSHIGVRVGICRTHPLAHLQFVTSWVTSQ